MGENSTEENPSAATGFKSFGLVLRTGVGSWLSITAANAKRRFFRSSMGRRGRVRYTKADFDRETIQAAFDDAVKAQAAYWQKVTQLERLLYDDFELDLEGLRGDACDLECSYDVDGLIAQAIEDLSDADDDGDPQ